MDSFDKFGETSLPTQDAFFNNLTGSPCSDSEYTHATRVLDALLLCDFFEKFRRIFLDFNSLDPLHYYTTPGLA